VRSVTVFTGLRALLTHFLILTSHISRADPSEAHPLTQEERDELDDADDDDHVHQPAVILTAPSTPKVSERRSLFARLFFVCIDRFFS